MVNWLRLSNVSFRFGAQSIFEDLNFALDDEVRVLGVIGQSGVGKSTLINLIAGFFTPSGGIISFGNETISGPSAERPVVFQDHNLFPWMSVLENVSFGLKAQGVAREERYRAADALLSEIGLNDRGHCYPSELSGGMQQRVGLARALAARPRCLLLDEPFASLDDKTKRATQGLFKRVMREHSVRAIHVTHDVKDAVGLSDAILILRSPGDSRLIRLEKGPAESQESLIEKISSELIGEI